MDPIYPHTTPDIARKRRNLAPNQQAAFEAFGKAVFVDGALPTKIKQIIAVAVAHVTQCPYCINGSRSAICPLLLRKYRNGLFQCPEV
ncbi:MAG TPA: carboxymuconolactone decarboxylase family protein, partial [Candidatus Binatia bacterium]